MRKKISPDLDLATMRHTAAHVLAAASTKLRPETKLGVGPAIDDGFYHDLEVNPNYTEEDLAVLQAKMEEIKEMDLPITQREVSRAEARELFAHDPYKLELIEEVAGETVGVSDMGEGFFITLCKGGHVSSTGQIGAFKLTRLAGVYWKGDTTRPQLQRIYGLAFPTPAELEAHLTLLAEAKKRDHRKLGRELDLFTFSPLVGPGLPLFTPRGTIIRRELETFLQSLQEPHGYQRVIIPHITKADLYKTSGHWEKFQADLFHVQGQSEESLVLKPMNCPHHTQIYAARPRSYRDLPLRLSEVTTVYRDEQAGELQGLTRVRSITQDDAHVFCRSDQIAAEAVIIMQIVEEFYAVFDFTLRVRLSLRDPAKPDKYLGSEATWQQAEASLRTLLEEKKVEFVEQKGEAAFYGPKIDFIARDSLGRDWQLATIQLDFNMPVRFALTYTDTTGQEQTPVMIHRAILGSFERFMAILLEHYAGTLPLWLAPTQVALLPIADAQHEYARQVAQELAGSGLRVETDERAISLAKKIREAQQKKVPVMLIMGKKELADTTIAVRLLNQGDQGQASLPELIHELTQKIRERK
ncbi:MAG: threonine--tRNA ligase [Candidatus Andersenbacteria bacterium]